jgi:hypothetical protein
VVAPVRATVLAPIVNAVLAFPTIIDPRVAALLFAGLTVQNAAVGNAVLNVAVTIVWDADGVVPVVTLMTPPRSRLPAVSESDGLPDPAPDPKVSTGVPPIEHPAKN